jgi:hypothetical protein
MAKTTTTTEKYGPFQIAMMQGSHEKAAQLLTAAVPKGKRGKAVVADLVTKLRVSRRSLFRYVKTLEEAGFIEGELLARRNMSGPSPEETAPRKKTRKGLNS